MQLFNGDCLNSASKKPYYFIVKQLKWSNFSEWRIWFSKFFTVFILLHCSVMLPPKYNCQFSAPYLQTSHIRWETVTMLTLNIILFVLVVALAQIRPLFQALEGDSPSRFYCKQHFFPSDFPPRGSDGFWNPSQKPIINHPGWQRRMPKKKEVWFQARWCFTHRA